MGLTEITRENIIIFFCYLKTISNCFYSAEKSAGEKLLQKFMQEKKRVIIIERRIVLPCRGLESLGLKQQKAILISKVHKKKYT